MNIKTLEKRIDSLEKIVDPKSEMKIICVDSKEEAAKIQQDLANNTLHVFLISQMNRPS